MQVRLEQCERDARRAEEDDAAHGEPRQREPRPLDESARLEREPLAHGDDGEPEHGRREYRSDGQRNGQHRGEVRPAGLVLEPERGQRLPGSEGVDDGAGGENDTHAEHRPDGRADHVT